MYYITAMTLDTTLTRRQRDILGYLAEHQESHGCAPTVREIMANFGLASPGAVSPHLQALEQKGYITRTSRGSRNILLHRKLLPSKGLPLLGEIAAGPPTMAVENFEGRVSLAEMFGDRGDMFLLKVRGQSMIGAGINDGDLVGVRQTAQVDNGEIAAVYIDGEVTVKRVFVRGDRVVLEPENDAMEAIVISGRTLEDFQVLGKVVGLVRTF